MTEFEQSPGEALPESRLPGLGSPYFGGFPEQSPGRLNVNEEADASATPEDLPMDTSGPGAAV